MADEEAGSSDEEGAPSAVDAKDLLVQELQDLLLSGSHYQLWLQLPSLFPHALDDTVCADWLVMMDHSLLVLGVFIVLGQVKRKDVLLISRRDDINQLVA